MTYKHKWDISVKLANLTEFCFDNEAVAYTQNTKMIDQFNSDQSFINIIRDIDIHFIR